MSKMKVKITDKLEKIFQFVDCKGYLMHDSKVITKEQYGKTFQELKIMDGAKFAHAVVINEGEQVPTEAIKWQRFQRLRTNDYVRMAYPGYYTWDAICFVPKEDIWFFGFGCMSSEERRDITLKV